MIRNEYSAGAVKMSFWFMEFRKVVQLLSEGNNWDEIKNLNQEKNIFAASTPRRADQIFRTVSARVKTLDESFYPVFLSCDLASQKLFALVAAMANDTLFFDFVYEVVREKMIIGSNVLSDSDVRIFFRDKQQQDEKAAGWTDATLQRLGCCYKTMLYEAGVIDKMNSVWAGKQGESVRAGRHPGVENGLGRKVKEERQILKPLIDPAMQRWLMDHDMAICVKALTGVR
jgi:hypothetical protein